MDEQDIAEALLRSQFFFLSRLILATTSPSPTYVEEKLTLEILPKPTKRTLRLVQSPYGVELSHDELTTILGRMT